MNRKIKAGIAGTLVTLGAITMGSGIHDLTRLESKVQKVDVLPMNDDSNIARRYEHIEGNHQEYTCRRNIGYTKTFLSALLFIGVADVYLRKLPSRQYKE